MHLFNFRIFRKLQKCSKITSYRKISNLQERKFEVPEQEYFRICRNIFEFVKISDFTKQITKNTKMTSFESKNSNLQKGKFEVPEQEYFWICLNFGFFEHFQNSTKTASFELKNQQSTTSRKIRGSRAGIFLNLF